MTFLQPLMLAALAGALVPIIIHLINRRKPRRQPFAAIEFVLKSVERVERRWRLRRFLLLAARVMLLAAIAFAAARPLFGTQAGGAGVARGPERLAIVLDASVSMRARYGGEQRAFDRAKGLARELIGSMGAEDQATIVLADREPKLVLQRLSASKPELLAALDDLEPSWAHGEISDAVTLAAQALATPPGDAADPTEPATSPKTGARVVVLSDLAGHGIRSAADLTVDPSGATAALDLIDVAGNVTREARANRGITAVEIANVPGNAPRTVEARIKVRSFVLDKRGDQEPVPVDVLLKSGEGELAGGMMEVPPGGVADKRLTYAFPEPGFVPLFVQLESDALAEDDQRHAVADVRKSVRTLIVDGEPSGLPKEDEVFYLQAALAAGAQDQPPPRIITPDDLSREDLAGVYDVIVLAGVSSFSPSDGPRLVSFVESGGGLWITAAEGMDLEQYNAELGRILPRPFRGLRSLSGDDISGGSGRVGFSAPPLDHPVMSVFGGNALAGLVSAETHGYLLLERERERAANTLLEFEDGQPALIEAETGRGRVVVLTTSIDRDLGDLPIRPGFLPLVRRLILHLGGALERPPEREILVGDGKDIAVPSGAITLEVVAPDGETTSWDRADLTNKPEVRFDKTTAPGVYTVRASFAASADPTPQEAFAVNVDAKESDLRPLAADEAKAVLLGTAAPGDGNNTNASAIARLGRSGLGKPEAIAAMLLVLMLGAFLLESALTSRPG